MTFSLPLRGQLILLLALVIIAAITDLRTRRIYNWLTLSGVLSGLAMNLFLADHWWQGLKFSLIGLVTGFIVYLVLYAIRAMGAAEPAVARTPVRSPSGTMIAPPAAPVVSTSTSSARSAVDSRVRRSPRSGSRCRRSP